MLGQTPVGLDRRIKVGPTLDKRGLGTFDGHGMIAGMKQHRRRDVTELHLVRSHKGHSLRYNVLNVVEGLHPVWFHPTRRMQLISSHVSLPRFAVVPGTNAQISHEKSQIASSLAHNAEMVKVFWRQVQMHYCPAKRGEREGKGEGATHLRCKYHDSCGRLRVRCIRVLIEDYSPHHTLVEKV